MKLNDLKPGIYVAAISGGVDSMVLLKMLSITNISDVKLIVAHLDHGIRPDSKEDRLLVESEASRLGLDFEFKEAHLSTDCSEGQARKVRYDFLETVKNKYNARLIVTAHHQDDLIETAILNVIRGTNRKGLSALINNELILRPLLNYSKSQITDYAKTNNVTWREDSTNTDTKYLRNYIRKNIVCNMDLSVRTQLVDIINKLSVVNKELDNLLELSLKANPDNEIDRQWFNSLPHSLAKEVFATWLRLNDIREFNKQTLERLVVYAKVSHPGKTYPIIKGYKLIVKANDLALGSIER